MPDNKDQEGISMALVHSKKGFNALNQISDLNMLNVFLSRLPTISFERWQKEFFFWTNVVI